MGRREEIEKLQAEVGATEATLSRLTAGVAEAERFGGRDEEGRRRKGEAASALAGMRPRLVALRLEQAAAEREEAQAVARAAYEADAQARARLEAAKLEAERTARALRDARGLVADLSETINQLREAERRLAA